LDDEGKIALDTLVSKIEVESTTDWAGNSVFRRLGFFILFLILKGNRHRCIGSYLFLDRRGGRAPRQSWSRRRSRLCRRLAFDPGQALAGPLILRIDRQDVLQTNLGLFLILDNAAEPEPDLLVALVEFGRLDQQLTGQGLVPCLGGGDSLLQESHEFFRHRLLP